jgi:type IV secretion system protein TrbC
MFVRLLSVTHLYVCRVHRPPFVQFGTAAACIILTVSAAHAAGSGMPWEAPLQRVLDSVQGPVAKIVAVIIITVSGISFAFGDTSGGFRRMVQVVFGLSIVFAASSFFLSFFSFGGGALI